jgi:hypothetical protein
MLWAIAGTSDGEFSPGREPVLHGEHCGRDTIQWLVEAGFFDRRPHDLPDPSQLHAAQPILAAGGRGLDAPPAEPDFGFPDDAATVADAVKARLDI